jgi:peptide-methionine (R)-S-oxide reductase
MTAMLAYIPLERIGVDMSESDYPDELPRTEAEWREHLTEEEYRILREAGTEPKFSGDLVDVEADGVFRCAGCGQGLFSSDTKYTSSSGWPSFYDVLEEGNVETELDTSKGMRRIEVLCSRCGGHLGHVFEDGPEPTGKRYCINSAALDFDPADE